MQALTSSSRRLLAVGIAGAVVVGIGVAAWPGGAPSETAAAEPSTTASQTAGPTTTASPPSIPRAYENPVRVRMADQPLMLDADWRGPYDADGSSHPIRRGNPRGDLSPCLHDPRTWPAERISAARYVDDSDPSHPPAVYQEYVLGFATPALAHEAVVAAAQEYDACPRPEGMGVDAAVIVTRRDVTLHGDIDEMIEVQREANAYSAVRYVMRVARRGQIVVVLENTVHSSDIRGSRLPAAVQRAAGLPFVCDPACPTGAP